jgi:hypothetical protein
MFRSFAYGMTRRQNAILSSIVTFRTLHLCDRHLEKGSGFRFPVPSQSTFPLLE